MISFATKVPCPTPRNIAVNPARSIPLLAFNRQGEIEVVLFDNTEEFIGKMRMPALRIPPFDLNNALILFRLSQDLGLALGVNAEDDADIFEYVAQQISPTIHHCDHAMLIDELTTSWKNIAKHPIIKKYQDGDIAARVASGLAIDPPSNSSMPYIGPFLRFAYEYIAGFLHTISQVDAINEATFAFLQLNELTTATLRGEAFSKVPHLQLQGVQHTMKMVGGEIKESAATFAQIDKRLQRPQGRWFPTVTGYVANEIKDVIEDFGVSKKAELIKTIEALLEGDKRDLTADEEILSGLAGTIALVTKSQDHPLYKNIISVHEKEVREANRDHLPPPAQPTVDDIFGAAKFAILDTLKQEDVAAKFVLRVPVNTRIPHLILGTPEKEAALYDQLEELPRYQLKAIANTATDAELKEEARTQLAEDLSLLDPHPAKRQRAAEERKYAGGAAAEASWDARGPSARAGLWGFAHFVREALAQYDDLPAAPGGPSSSASFSSASCSSSSSSCASAARPAEKRKW